VRCDIVPDFAEESSRLLSPLVEALGRQTEPGREGTDGATGRPTDPDNVEVHLLLFEESV